MYREMKKLTTTGFALGFVALTVMPFQTVWGQHKSCGTDELHAQMLQDPRYRQQMEAQEERYQTFVTAPKERTTGSLRTIPVVVHFIQSSDIELVDDAAVYSQIEVLNEDFRKMAGTPGDGSGVDTDYEFCLASIDPNGCPTTGINRVVGGQWAYHEQADAAIMKGLIQWDPHKYLNIWVPRTIETSNGSGQVIGYATFPFNLSLFPNLDGIVIHSSYFGRNSDLTYQGRTTTHEAGHWVGLFHTFQGNCTGATASTCASQGDRVCDTPQAFEANFGCPTINSCTDSPTDLPDQIENYMDYSDGTCQSKYTQGQKDRMDFYFNSVRDDIWSPANLTATGCDGTVATCAPRPDFQADNVIVCVGQPVQFIDMSTLSPNTWSWTFTGASPATSTAQNQTVIYNTPGTYDVSLVTSNGTGSATETKIAYIEVVSPSTTGLVQGFEGILSLPQYWRVTDNQGVNTWQLATNARSEGQNSMKVKNFEARNAGEAMSLHSNPFTLQNMISGYMTFDYSYKKYSGLTSDALKVHISTDCGASWTELWSKAGPYLATVAGSTTSAEWVPTQASHWLPDTISLDSFAGEPNVKLRFEVISGGGQTVYLDNINMNMTLVGNEDPTSLGWDFTVAPNPFQHDLRIHYTLQRPTAMAFVLTDVSGKALARFQTEKQGAGRHELTVEAVRALPAGIYFLKGTGAGGSMTRKLVKMN
jgi:PKD repeat protein